MNGITLIALVITIIVLLILAGISIATLTGENGLLTKANTAKTETSKASAKEKVQIAVMGSYDNKGEIDNNALKTNLENVEGIDKTTIPDTITDSSFSITVKVDGYEVIIEEDGKVAVKGENPPAEQVIITASDIANSIDKSKLYGATVSNYTCANSAGVNAWKIFYADNNNIYLIADDYIHYDYCPSSANQTINKTTDYKLSMGNVIKDYSGSNDITDIKIQTLNSNYFNYLTANNTMSANNNMKAVAYMLDTNVWSVFKNSTHAEYAIGGPTIEMLIKSYSQKYNVDYKVQVSSNIGYQVSKDGGVTWDRYSTSLDVSDSLYTINNIEKAHGMWIASPFKEGADFLACALSDSSISYTTYVPSENYKLNNIGFRPLVCLNSDVQLEKKADGVYAII